MGPNDHINASMGITSGEFLLLLGISNNQYVPANVFKGSFAPGRLRGTQKKTYITHTTRLIANVFLFLQNGMLSAIPFVMMMTFHFIIAIVFDRIRKRNLCSVTRLRKVFNTIGMPVFYDNYRF